MDNNQVTYRFGDWVVEPHLNRLSKDGETHQIEPRTMDVLAHLLAHADQVVSSDELLDRFWAGRHAEPSMVVRRINQIRRCLADDAKQPTYIETILKRGYRTIARVEPISEPHETGSGDLLSTLKAHTPPFPAYEGNEPYVFVCYGHTDRAEVYPELIGLRDAGVNIWYDEGISPGSEWTEELAKAIAGCTRFLYFISPSAVMSTNCRDEVQYAREVGKPFVTVYLKPTELPEGLRLEIGRIQALLKYQLAEVDYRRKLQAVLDVGGVPAKPPGMTPETTVEAETDRSPKLHYRAVAAVAVVALLGLIGWAGLEFFDKSADAPMRTIAVLPFVNIGDTEDYFSDGVTEEILNRMIRVRDVRVISRQSSFAYKGSALDVREIGQQLGADYILQGSVRRNADLVRIAVRLTDTADGIEIWGGTYNRELADILRVQDEIAQLAISEFVPMAVEPSPRADVDPVAYDLHLRARRALASNDWVAAKPLLESAVAVDPDFADAYGALAKVHSGLRAYPRFVGNDELMRVLAVALELDPDNVDALEAEARLKLYLEFDLQGAISKFESLIRRFPNSRAHYGYSFMLAAALKRDEMLLVAERARQIDPHSSLCAINEFWAHLAVGDFGRARRAANRIPTDPAGEDDRPGTARSYWLTFVDIASGRFDAAEDHLELQGLSKEQGKFYFLIWLAIERGELDVARDLYESTSKHVGNMPYYWLPLDVVMTGETSRTLDEIENPTADNSIIWIMRLQFMDRWLSEHGAPEFREAFAMLRNEPRYQQALRKHGIDNASLAKIQVDTAELWD